MTDPNIKAFRWFAAAAAAALLALVLVALLKEPPQHSNVRVGKPSPHAVTAVNLSALAARADRDWTRKNGYPSLATLKKKLPGNVQVLRPKNDEVLFCAVGPDGAACLLSSQPGGKRKAVVADSFAQAQELYGLTVQANKPNLPPPPTTAPPKRKRT